MSSGASHIAGGQQINIEEKIEYTIRKFADGRPWVLFPHYFKSEIDIEVLKN